MNIFESVLKRAKAAQPGARQIKNDILNPTSPGYTDPTVQPRLFNDVLANRARKDFSQQAALAGKSYYNRGTRGLQRRGLGRSAGFLGLLSGATNAQSQVNENLNLPFALGEQNFTEGARQFDTGVAENTRSANEMAKQFSVNSKQEWLNYLARLQEIKNNKPPSIAVNTPYGGISV